jgi:hypothetical protein
MLERTIRQLMGMACLALAFSGFIFAPAAFSQESISSTKDLQAVLEKAVMCKPDGLNLFNGSEFDGGPSDPKRKLEALGVSIANESHHGGETVYRFPPGVRVFGQEVSQALYFSESTTLFFVNLRSGRGQLETVNKSLRLSPVPKGNPDGYGYFNEFDVRSIRKLSKGDDEPPDTIFSAVANHDGHDHLVIGCQNLAW